jgi:Na+-transporting NADH:ubiquinone oxidoreductase subunit NqrE
MVAVVVVTAKMIVILELIMKVYIIKLYQHLTLFLLMETIKLKVDLFHVNI